MSCPFLTFFDVTHCEAEGIRLLTLGLAEVYPEECERAKEKHEKEAYLDPVKAFRSQEAWVLKDPLWVWARGARCGDVKRNGHVGRPRSIERRETSCSRQGYCSSSGVKRRIPASRGVRAWLNQMAPATPRALKRLHKSLKASI